MREEGVPEEIIESFLVDVNHTEGVQVWGQNALPFLIFVKARRCWLYTIMGERIGLNWVQLGEVIERTPIWRDAETEEKDQAYEALDLMESTALEEWQELAKSK